MGTKQITKTSTRNVRWYGNGNSDGIPYLHDLQIKGRLIVVEGPDSSGRSTQIQRITEKLEADGFAPVC